MRRLARRLLGRDLGRDREVPAVSIVMPTYNRARLLPESMESVLSQDYPDVELLVVDDGSADDTPAVLSDYGSRYPEARFRFVRCLNGGQARALNWGYGLARGELIGYLCDDDLLMPGAIELQARELIADPEAAVAYSGYRVIDSSGAVEDTVRPIQHSPTEALRLHDTVIGPGGLVRRRALEASGGWPESMRFMADLVLWIDIGLRGRSIRVSEPLVSWRRHPGSVTVNLGAEHAREHLTAHDRALELDGIGDPPESVRAEALRNASVFGAIFGGESQSWPGDRYLVFDFHRKLISSEAAGCQPGSEPDWARAERAALLYRELVDVALELADAKNPPAAPVSAPPAGIEAARRRLREVGALPKEDGSYAEVDEAEMRRGLIDAAVACGAATGAEPTRFGILDLRRTHLPDAERAELEALGFVGSDDEIAAALDVRRRELVRLSGEPSSAASARS